MDNWKDLRTEIYTNPKGTWKIDIKLDMLKDNDRDSEMLVFNVTGPGRVSFKKTVYISGSVTEIKETELGQWKRMGLNAVQRAISEENYQDGKISITLNNYEFYL